MNDKRNTGAGLLVADHSSNKLYVDCYELHVHPLHPFVDLVTLRQDLTEEPIRILSHYDALKYMVLALGRLMINWDATITVSENKRPRRARREIDAWTEHFYQTNSNANQRAVIDFAHALMLMGLYEVQMGNLQEGWTDMQRARTLCQEHVMTSSSADSQSCDGPVAFVTVAWWAAWCLECEIGSVLRYEVLTGSRSASPPPMIPYYPLPLTVRGIPAHPSNDALYWQHWYGRTCLQEIIVLAEMAPSARDPFSCLRHAQCCLDSFRKDFGSSFGNPVTRSDTSALNHVLQTRTWASYHWARYLCERPYLDSAIRPIKTLCYPRTEENLYKKVPLLNTQEAFRHAVRCTWSAAMFVEALEPISQHLLIGNKIWFRHAFTRCVMHLTEMAAQEFPEKVGSKVWTRLVMLNFHVVELHSFLEASRRIVVFGDEILRMLPDDI